MGNEESLAGGDGTGGTIGSSGISGRTGSFSQHSQNMSGGGFLGVSSAMNEQQNFRSQSASFSGGTGGKRVEPLRDLQQTFSTPSRPTFGTMQQKFTGVTSFADMKGASGSNSIPRKMSVPGKPLDDNIAPDVDMSGLTEEEKRQIAAVMERAQALREEETTAIASVKLSPFQAAKPPTSRADQPAINSFKDSPRPVFNKPVADNSSTTSKDPLNSLRIPQKPTGFPQQLSPNSLSNVQTLPIPNSPRGNGRSPQDEKVRAFVQDSRSRPNSWSLSSESSFGSQDHGSLLDSTYPPPSPSGLSNLDINTSNTPPRPAGAQMSKCPLCQQTDLKVMMVNGKQQPLIGQLCARCGLIVCSKCGKVTKDAENKKAYWLCSQCVDIPWEPPAYEEPEVTKPPMSHQTYIAPLTHLVTGDNKVHSDVLRSSSASFFDEPEYILPSVDIQEVPANQAWLDPPSYQSVTSSGHQTSQSFFQQIADEPIIDYPLDESESYGNYPDYEESPEETAQESQTSGNQTDAFPPDYYGDETNYSNFSTFSSSPKNNNFSWHTVQKETSIITTDANREDPVYTDDGYWQRAIPTEPQWDDEPMNDHYYEETHQFSSHDSLYEKLEEETSDYGSQIHAACSDIASLSSSTSGGELGLQKTFSAPGSYLQWSENHGDRQGGDSNDHARGAALRRSNLVENFRSVPTSLARPQKANNHGHPGKLVSNGDGGMFGQNAASASMPEGEKLMERRGSVGNENGTGRSAAQTHGDNGMSMKASMDKSPQRTVPQHTDHTATQPTSKGSVIPEQSTGSTTQHAPSHREMHHESTHSHQQHPPNHDITRATQQHLAARPSHSTSGGAETRRGSTGSSQTQPNTHQEAANHIHGHPQHTHGHAHGTHQHMYGHTHGSTHMLGVSGANHHVKGLIHQTSRDEPTSEIDEFDSALDSTTDGNAQDFDTVSQSSQFSSTSTATLPLSSSMTGLNKEERRSKRRLPLLPKDDQAGYCMTPEERERQKKELKRRLRGTLLKLAGNDCNSSTFHHVNDNTINSPHTTSATLASQDWSNDLQLTASVGGSGGENGSKLNGKVIKRKKHKHITQAAQDSPKVQLLKQQLRALAARKAGHEDDNLNSFGSLPNKPTQITRYKTIPGDDVSSSTEYLTDSTLGSVKNNNRHYHATSDPALFRSVLEQYRKVAWEERRDRENASDGFTTNMDDFKINGIRPPSQYHSDPEIQDIVNKLQQINRDLAETKELFRSTSSLALSRRAGHRWRSETDLIRPKWHRDRYLLENRVDHPLDSAYQNNPIRQQRFWQEGYNNDYDCRAYSALRQYEDVPMDEEQFYSGEPTSFRGPSYWNEGPLTADGRRFYEEQFHGEYMEDPRYSIPTCTPQWSPYQSLLRGMRNTPIEPQFTVPNYPFAIPEVSNNEDLIPYEPFDDPNFLPMGPGAVVPALLPQRNVQFAQSVAEPAGPPPVVDGKTFLDDPLPDSRVSYSEESAAVRHVEGSGWDDEKENWSETGSDGMDANEKLSRSVLAKKPKKDSNQPKYSFPTKRILLTRDPKDRSVSGNGLGVKVAGGKLIPNSNSLAAFISKIYDNGVMATLGEVKEGDQVLEWNGISLHNKSYEEVQEILDHSNGEVEILLRCDYNVRDLEAELEEARLARRASHQAEKVRIRDYDSGERSPLPGGRAIFGGSQRKHDGTKADDDEEIVYRPSNQLVPPSPGIMQRKKSTTSSGHTPVTGDVMLRMTYERCTLTLQVIKARNLKPADKSGFSDPYCKLSLVPGRASEYKYRTRHVMQTLNPEWKETFTFQSIDPNEIHHKQIEITVWDWDRLSADDFLGEVIVDLADPVHLDGTKRWYPLGERRPGIIEDA